MNSQFVKPVHKFFYLGPFEPKKKFNVDQIPSKEKSLYGQLLVENKEWRLQTQEKPAEILKGQTRELSLMYKASCAREKSLRSKIKETKVRFPALFVTVLKSQNIWL